MATYYNKGYTREHFTFVKCTPTEIAWHVLSKTIIKLANALVNLITSILKFIRKNNKAASGKNNASTKILEEVFITKVKKPIAKTKTTVDTFKPKATTIRHLDLTSTYDNFYIHELFDDLPGNLPAGLNGPTNHNGPAGINGTDGINSQEQRNPRNAIAFKMKDRGVKIPSSTTTFYLGKSRVDGCSVYRYYGNNIDVIKQHYNIEELHELYE